MTVDLSEDVETALRRCVSSGHTRLVVTEDENHDRVKGIVHANALAQLLLTEGPDATIEGLVREAPIVPETKPLDDLLADLQRQRTSLAIVIDEYGRTAGIVTVEDIIEEVVGEIDDETDPLGGAVRRLANGDWFVRGHVAITDLDDYGLHLPVDSDAYNSVGGFVFGELGGCPSAATRSSTTATRSASSRCARTASRRCGSGRTAARPRARPKLPRIKPLSGQTRLRIATPWQIAQVGETRYLAANRETASAVEEERGRSWGGSTERNTYGRRTQGSESGGRSVSGGGVAMRGTFVAIGMFPTSPQSVLNISQDGSCRPAGSFSTRRSRARPSCPSAPAAIIASIRAGTSAPIERPIAAATSSPT